MRGDDNDYMRQYTFARCMAEAKAKGWPDVIGADNYAAEWTDLDRLGDENLPVLASTQAQVRKLKVFKELTDPARGDEKLRRLSLAALQGSVWQLRWPSSDWRRIKPAKYLAEYLLKEIIAGSDAAYVLSVLSLLCISPAQQEGPWLETLIPDAVQRAADVVAAGATLPGEAKDLLRLLREKVPDATDAIDALLGGAAGTAGAASAPAPSSPPPLRSGEPWTDAALADLATLDTSQQAAWSALIDHASQCHATKPGAKWIDRATKLIAPLGADAIALHLGRWFPHLATSGAAGRQVEHRGATYNNVPPDASQDILAGLAWLAAVSRSPQAFAVIADLAEISFRTIPRFGPRCLRVGQAAARALASVGTLDAIGQLARLELRVRTPKGRKVIKKLLAEAIEKSGLSRQDVEETSVPDFGMTHGRATIPIGDWTAEIDATDAYHPKLSWRKPDGTVAKSVAVLKKSQPDAVDAPQRILKDVEGMLPAQRTRLELLLRDNRTWRIDIWRQRYLGHGLLAPMVRRLIWTIDGTAVLFVDGAPVDVNGNPVEFARTAEVALWHPVGRKVEEIVAWRRRLEALRITQPFKQAHREVYLLTDAELETRTYSNRFAAHIVKTPTFIAIGQTRKWTVSLYGEAKLELPQFGLRAEYWSQAVWDDQVGHHMHYGPPFLATDQVRFYRTADATPMRLLDVPPLAFSEVMRDVDLFVGIASVGADPNWTDGGNARYRDYWQHYSFGDLNESAKTRKAVLERLVPRLKIADRCTLTDKFLVVRGALRTYKIHLGSGNILMEPNDQYLCIVPARGAVATATADDVFLPFEGDTTLSIILSKAFMLADDTSILDPTITRQIKA